MRTLPLVLHQVRHPLVKTPLYHHQAIMMDEWECYETFLVETKTGTGKTTAAVMPLLKYKEKGFLVYPTNELIRDQVESIAAIARLEGLNPCVFTPNTSKEEYGKADVVLIHIDAEKLKEWDEKLHLGGKWAVLKFLLQADKERKLILTNPDILFLIFAFRYRAEALAALMGFQNLIIDEFHLYQGVEFAHALFMVHLARHLGIFKRVVLLSATPAPEVRKYLEEILSPFVINSKNISCYSTIGMRTAVHEVEVITKKIDRDVVEKAIEIIKELKPQIDILRKQNISDEYIPLVVVLNSVVNAMRLEDRLAEEGFNREELLIIRGLTSKSIRIKDERKLIAIGTSAIEVGIDFKCDYLIFEATEAPSFLQRFGRLGRHQPGVAYVLCSSNVELGISKLPPKITRAEFEEHIYEWYTSPETRPWFIATEGGLLTVFALANNIVARVLESKGITIEDVEEIKNRIRQIMLIYAQKIGIEKYHANAEKQYKLAQRGIKGFEWVYTYQNLNTFRTSLPSVTVCDFAEKERRGDYEFAKYNVDIGTLLKRGEGITFNPKIPNNDGQLGMITVKGYGRYKKIQVIPDFNDRDCNVIMTTKNWPQLAFLQDGKRIPISEIMTLKEHIFVVLPKVIRTNIDWRLPVFDCGNHVIAFDGMALLLQEIYTRIESNHKYKN